MAAPVNPIHLRPLIKGLPDTLKIHVQSLRERIQEAIDCNKQNTRNSPEHVLTLPKILHNIVITYGREMGWVDLGGSRDGSRRVQKTSREPLPIRLPLPQEPKPFHGRSDWTGGVGVGQPVAPSTHLRGVPNAAAQAFHRAYTGAGGIA